MIFTIDITVVCPTIWTYGKSIKFLIIITCMLNKIKAVIRMNNLYKYLDHVNISLLKKDCVQMFNNVEFSENVLQVDRTYITI